MGARSQEPAPVGRRLDPRSRQHTHSTRLRLAAGDAMEGLTATDEKEREDALRRLEFTLVSNHLFHESIHPRKPTRFTRRWFSWADMLYVELVLAAAGAALPG